MSYYVLVHIESFKLQVVFTWVHILPLAVVQIVGVRLSWWQHVGLLSSVLLFLVLAV